MKFVFWQNILSPHQSDFLSELANVHDVTLVVMSRIDSNRIGQNWHATYNENVTIIVSPSLTTICRIINVKDNDILHCFSGFLAYPKLSFALFLSCLYRNNNSVISEAVPLIGFRNKCKLFVRKNLALLCRQRILQVFAIGVNGIKYFQALGFSQDKLSEFGYFVSPPILNHGVKKPSFIVFVGRLMKIKGINPILEMCKNIRHENIKVKIIGSGPLSPEIKTFVKKHKLEFVELISDIPRVEVMEIIGKAGCLMLPNTGDEGWGVVVNEALLQGTPVVCSSKTGSCVAVTKDVQGVVLNEVTPQKLIEAINVCLTLDSNNIKAIANRQLLPKVGVDYFTRQLTDKRSDCAPWHTKDIQE
ncbi:glycosyltransferase [Colwellia sp. Bg11-12]|uniref:glycosyltransferase n=1 Tax=Colwellia sp. Bg11-12 TaxID=2759817 RepID=UPI0015F4AD81|nr:glycosyltransferase [Colwellia sp. Bg11-12]MBA6263220.1 glycosyltransferase [Colwellia sp. Bg11-12]